MLGDALKWSVFWIAVSLAFNMLVYYYRGRGPAVVWLTSYLLEKFLSIDNLFVFLTLFASFKTPPQYQHKVRACVIAGIASTTTAGCDDDCD